MKNDPNLGKFCGKEGEKAREEEKNIVLYQRLIIMNIFSLKNRHLLFFSSNFSNNIQTYRY